MEPRPLKIVAVNGSERRQGNNAAALTYASEVLARRGVVLEVIRLVDLRMGPCGPCGDCNFRSTPCEVEDDVRGAVDQMAQADGIIYATSVHGFGSAPLMPIFLERAGTGILRFDRRLTNKVAGVVVTGRMYSQVETYSYLVNHALLNRMILIGHGFPSVLQGDVAGEVLGDAQGMDMFTRMLQRMVDMMTLLREYRQITGRDGLAVTTPTERAAYAHP